MVSFKEFNQKQNKENLRYLFPLGHKKLMFIMLIKTAMSLVTTRQRQANYWEIPSCNMNVPLYLDFPECTMEQKRNLQVYCNIDTLISVVLYG